MNILVLGASGLLGNAVFRVLSERCGDRVYGTVRNPLRRKEFAAALHDRLVTVGNLEDPAELNRLFDTATPDVVINCLALGKATAPDLTRMLAIYSLLPRRLACLCRSRGTRLIQMSSDGVFSGRKGRYTEDDVPDATDAYGLTKFLGECEGPGVFTIRTSIIGHELSSRISILEWFLSQDQKCRCYTRAIFSGLPAVVLAQVIRDILLSRPELEGVYHISASPISKHELLSLVAEVYGKKLRIIPDDSVVIDRSLCDDRFRHATGYTTPAWQQLIETMHSYKFGLKESN